MGTDAMAAIAAANSLDDLYRIFADHRLTAGWHKKRRSLWPMPNSKFQPLHWSYAEAAYAMDRAGEWMSTEDAERRNLLMFNPVDDNDYDTVRTMVTAYQMIKPGEYARTHRHTANAMRLILDAEPGVYTVVNGLKIPMRSGDFLLTPNWYWHSHYNEGVAKAYWIDFLDVPLVHRLEPMFFEDLPAVHQTVTAEPDPDQCPLVFPRQVCIDLLAAQAPRDDGSRRLVLDTRRYIPTMEMAYMQIPAGSGTAMPRTTASRIFAVTSGAGAAKVGSKDFAFNRGDVFCVPSWQPFAIAASQETVLLEVNDEPTLGALGFYRVDGVECV